MDDIIEVSEFNLDDNFEDDWGQKKSSNFGGGLELLMNDKKKDMSGPTSDIDIDDLKHLETELNDLAQPEPMSNSYNSGLFGMKTDFDDKPSVRFICIKIRIERNPNLRAFLPDSWNQYVP